MTVATAVTQSLRMLLRTFLAQVLSLSSAATHTAYL